MEHVYVCHIQLSSEVRLAPELLLPPQHISTLSQLRRPRYGYELRQALAERDVPIEEGTLYPLLRRLESQGLLHSEWQTESGSPRRY